MWVIAEYEATTLFSLKPATATSSGGKTLLVPTPYAIKMALLDVVCRVEGQAAGEAIWDDLCVARVALRPAQQVIVNNTFTKILKPRRNPAEPGTQHAGPLQKTIGYREYAFLDGKVGIAVELTSTMSLAPERLANWLINLQYLGKRGSFMQVQGPPQAGESLPEGFIIADGNLGDAIPLNRIMQQIDDTGRSLTFDKANVYSSTRVALGKDRLLLPLLLPYRVASSSRGYTQYVMVEP